MPPRRNQPFSLRRRTARLRRVALLVALALGLTIGMIGQAQSAGDGTTEMRRLAVNAIDQLNVAIREAVFAWPASEVTELRPRAARMLNVLVGPASRHYQADIGDPPGADGVGVLTHLQRLREAIRSHGQGTERNRALLFSLEIALTFGQDAEGKLLSAIRTRDVEALQTAVQHAFAFLSAARGAREDPLSEGGVRALLAQLEAL